MRGVTDRVGRQHYRCISYVDLTVARTQVRRGSIRADALNTQVSSISSGSLTAPTRGQMTSIRTFVIWIAKSLHWRQK